MGPNLLQLKFDISKMKIAVILILFVCYVSMSESCGSKKGRSSKPTRIHYYAKGGKYCLGELCVLGNYESEIHALAAAVSSVSSFLEKAGLKIELSPTDSGKK